MTPRMKIFNVKKSSQLEKYKKFTEPSSENVFTILQ